MGTVDTARAAAAHAAARQLASVSKAATRAAARFAGHVQDADVVGTFDVPQGASGDDVAQIVAEAAQTSAVTVVVLRNTTAP